jgi:hypothetical protein
VITANPPLLKDRFVCPGIITFTCETRGDMISWSSDEYIAPGNEMLIQFVRDEHAVNHIEMRLNGSTVAKLTQDEGVLVSTLQINTTYTVSVSKNLPLNLSNASITCSNRRIDFQLVGKNVISL